MPATAKSTKRSPLRAATRSAAPAARACPPAAPQAPASVELAEMPGHQIRRLHQIAVALFLQEAGDDGLTPVQYAALQAVDSRPLIDQRTLARLIGLDTSTLGGVIDRLEARGLLERQASPEDRRVKLVRPTAAGRQLLAGIVPAVLRAQERILAPLGRQERREFIRMLDTLVTANNEVSRAPSLSE